MPKSKIRRLSPEYENLNLQREFKRLKLDLKNEITLSGLVFEIMKTFKKNGRKIYNLKMFHSALKKTDHLDEITKKIIFSFLNKDFQNSSNSMILWNKKFYIEMINSIMLEMSVSKLEYCNFIKVGPGRINTNSLVFKPLVYWFLNYGLNINTDDLLFSIVKNDVFVGKKTVQLDCLILDIF